MLKGTGDLECFHGYLSKLLQHQGEDPEIQHDLCGSGAKGRRGAEV